MITVENPLYLRGIPVFRDSADPDLFWVLPTAPHLAANPVGDSSFTLFEYRTADGSGGGFAELEIELTVPGDAALAAMTGRQNARLAPVLFRSGDVQLLTPQVASPNPVGPLPDFDPSAITPPVTANSTAGALVQDVLGSTVAPLTPPFHTVFALDVTEQGAALLAQSATLATAPIGVVYQLRFLAQTPALHAHVTMDYSRMYDHFAASLGFTYYVSVRLDLELSWLVEHGFVTVEITQFTDQADQQRQQQAVLDLVQARIQGDFFRSSMPQQTDRAPLGGTLGQLFGNQSGQNITSSTALFVLKARLDIEKELKTFEIFYDGHTVEELTHVVSGFIGELVAGDPTAPVVRQITAEDPFFATVDVRVIVAVSFADVPDLREAAVTISYGQHVETFVATADVPGPFRFSCPLDSAQPDYQTEASFHFDPTSSAGPATIDAAPSTRHDRAYVVGSTDAFSVVRVRVTASDTASELVPQLPVTLRIAPIGGGPALAHDVLTLDSQHPQQDWYRRVPGPASAFTVMARADWQDAQGVVHTGDEVEVLDADFVARGPIVEQLSVLVEPAVDWQQVRTLLVEIQHDVIGTVQARTLTFSATDGTDARGTSLALDDPTKRSYRWRSTVLRIDGTSSSTDWVVADGAVLAVTDGAPSRQSVQVVWLGDQATALAMQVNFWVTPPSGVEQQVGSALLQPGQTQQTVSWDVPTGSTAQASYRYEVHRLDAAGDTVVHGGQESSSILVVRTNG